MCVALAVLAVALRAPTFVDRLFDPDEAAIGVQGMVVRAGGTLYKDIFDRKPPLPPLALRRVVRLDRFHRHPPDAVAA